ncbi:hypothetical protein EAI30_06795 [Romboutsia ilealis]|uniref:Uracil-DNA glycosylase-like domain-containing protein n=1 Tax=Romboutsia faecis TaxID=2764597 RepID=A0ABR7JL62_9FIRM|nr:hypothetical protein [Romboutsia faecis]MBC5995438.1 hypothetical protein [Romboutsia faecis]MRN24319.1 hypothetical protein [Romboutsia ilealis]
MKYTLDEYIDKIKLLPIKNKYTKEEILTQDFLIDKDNYLEIYYAPHNEYINPNAKIFIVGITPGFQQMSTAIATARDGIEQGKSVEEIKYDCKVAGRFSGSLRKNIINMLDEINLNKSLNINSCDELFKERDYLLHTTSLIPYSVFSKGNNYTGHSPKLMKSEFLMKYVHENIRENIEKLGYVLIIPLGKAVEEVLDDLVNKNIIKEEQILRGFPHPSGANAHRLTQLRDNKDNMMKIIENYLK